MRLMGTVQLKRRVAVVLISALVSGLPGPAFYEAAAQTVPVEVGPSDLSASPLAVQGSAVLTDAQALASPLPGGIPLAASIGLLPLTSPALGRSRFLAGGLGRASSPEGLVGPAMAASRPHRLAALAPHAKALAAVRSAAALAPASSASPEQISLGGRRIFDWSGLRANEPDGPEEGELAPLPEERVPETPAASPETPGQSASAPPPAPGSPAEEKVKLPRSLWGLVVGHQILIVLGIYLHMFSQPFLVYGLTGSKAMIGVIRNVHFGSYTATSFLPIGPTIDKTDFQLLFNGTSVVRALLMGAIPFLFLTHHLALAALAAIVAVNPLFQNMMTTADAAATDAFLGTDEKLNKEAAAVLAKVGAVSDILIPFAAGWIVSSLVQAYGDPGGYAMAYAGYAAFLLLATPFFTFMVKDPRYADPTVPRKPTRRILNLFLPLTVALEGLLYVAGVTQAIRAMNSVYAAFRAAHGPLVSWAFLGVLIAASPLWLPVGVAMAWLGRLVRIGRAARAALAKFQASGRSSPEPAARSARRERLARFFDRFETTQGIAVLLRSRVLSTLVVVGAIETFLSDALMFVVLPNYIIDVVNPRLDLAGLPFIGSLLSTRAGIFTLMYMAAAIGALFAAHWIEGRKGDERLLKYGHPRFYRTAALGTLAFILMLVPTFWLPAPAVQHMIHEGYKLISSGAGGAAAGKAMVLQGLSHIPRWTFFASLGVVMFVQFIERLAHTPLLVAMRPVRRKEIPNEKLGVTNQAFQMIDVALMGIGALSIGFMMDILSIQMGLLLITAGLAASAGLEWLAPRWLSRENPKGWYPGNGASPLGSETRDQPNS